MNRNLDHQSLFREYKYNFTQLRFSQFFSLSHKIVKLQRNQSKDTHQRWQMENRNSYCVLLFLYLVSILFLFYFLHFPSISISGLVSFGVKKLNSTILKNAAINISSSKMEFKIVRKWQTSGWHLCKYYVRV